MEGTVSTLSIAHYFPWRRVKVVSQNVNLEPPSALIRIEPDHRFGAICHDCGGPARTVHSHGRKLVRDLPFGGHEMTLQIEYRKIWCDTCGGVRVEQLEFVDTSQRITNRLAAYAAALCQLGMSVQAVARHLDLDPKTVKALDKAALEVAFGETCYEGLQRLAIDEIAVRKGHSYMTVVLDYDTGRVIWMGKGRQIETLDEFFKNMPENVRNGIRAVALDMWDAFINAVKRWCPNADIVFDLFHVVKAFNKVIDDIRNEEFRKSDREGRELLKGSKYLLLRRGENLKPEQRLRLKEILAVNERLNIVYWLKDLLKHIWDYHRPGWAESALIGWCLAAEEDGHPALLRFARKLERYKYGILNHCKHPIHTSKIEGVNNKIKVIKRVAYGFHDLQYFALKVKQALPGHESSN
jgi:transposase